MCSGARGVPGGQVRPVLLLLLTEEALLEAGPQGRIRFSSEKYISAVA